MGSSCLWSCWLIMIWEIWEQLGSRGRRSFQSWSQEGAGSSALTANGTVHWSAFPKEVCNVQGTELSSYSWLCYEALALKTSICSKRINIEGVRGISPQNTLLWHVDYFDLKAFEKQQVSQMLLRSPWAPFFFLKEGDTAPTWKEPSRYQKERH